MTGVRQAALCIHGLSPKDQKWILKKLPRQQRLTIKGMLRELNAIGIPAEQGWLPQIEQKIRNDRLDESFANAAMKNIETIDAASLAQIKKLLLVESDEFIASLLGIRHWMWKEQLLSVFSKQRRSHLEYLLNENKQTHMKTAAVTAMLSVIADAITLSGNSERS